MAQNIPFCLFYSFRLWPSGF